MSNYEIIKERIAVNKESKKGYNYCNAIIMLSGVNINALKEEQLMLMEARLKAYEEVYNQRKPGKLPMLEGRSVESWKEIIEIRYAYLDLIEEGKQLEKALALDHAITENTRTVQFIKAANALHIKELNDIMSRVVKL